MSVMRIGQVTRSLAVIGIICICAIVFGVRMLSGFTSQSKLVISSTVVTSAPAAMELLAQTWRRQIPADVEIQAAQALLQQTPDEPSGYNQLSAAYIRKGRETGDFGFNAKAETALNRSLKLAPDNYEALKLQATLLLTYHQFSEALVVARHTQQLYPRTPEIYGAMTDALVELGDYEGAIAAVRTMLNLRPDASAYARVSYLRALHGDRAGAVAAMRIAVQAVNPRDLESVAWYHVHLGVELMNMGSLAEGEREVDKALHVFPSYHLALAAKARVRLAAGDKNSAVDFYRLAQERVPLPDTAIALGDLYTYLGRLDEAKRQYDLVEFIERAGTAMSQTYSRELALFWANHNIKLDEALAIAQQERAMRADIYTFDVLAWCLFKQGELTEAKTAIDQALRLHTKDARIYYHAGMIQHSLGDRAQAAKYLKLALEINPYFDVLQADITRQTLDTVSKEHPGRPIGSPLPSIYPAKEGFI